MKNLYSFLVKECGMCSAGLASSSYESLPDGKNFFEAQKMKKSKKKHRKYKKHIKGMDILKYT